MGILTSDEIRDIKEKISSNVSELGKQYKSRKLSYFRDTVDYNLVEERERDGWERTQRQYKTKAEIIKEKPFSKKFEDKVWVMMYELGFRNLNVSDNLKLRYGKNSGDLQQIDVIAVDSEVALIIECKSSQDYRNKDYKNYFESLPLKIDGFRKCIKEVYGERRIKYIFATEKQILSKADINRLEQTKSFHMDDNATSYIQDIIKNYKKASKFQFFGIIFKREIINLDTIDVPALSGEMGGKKYYMFSIEPGHLLKVGFILHRTRTNEREDPTYQRLLVPSRLRGIQKFIENEGFFPNSIIVNFNTKESKKKLEFQQSSSKNLDSNSRHGVLKIPNSYSIAYVIDGQHRLYGFADTDEIFKATIPVVAFENLSSDEQLGMFLDINENQKKIAPRLKLTLQEDINWESPNTLSRMKALRSGIINRLSDLVGPFRDYLSIGEETKELSPTFIDNALRKAPGLLPKVKSNKLLNDIGILYDLQNQDQQNEMENTRVKIADLINKLYIYIGENYKDLFENKRYFIRSNRGLFAFVYVIGSLNKYLSKKNRVDITTDVDERIKFLKPYLDCLLSELTESSMTNEDPSGILTLQGQAAEKAWSMYFESIIHKKYTDFYTDELKLFEETQDEETQVEARGLIDEIEEWIKTTTINQLKELFGDSWDLEINNVVTDAEKRAKDEIAKRWQMEKKRVKITWEDMVFIKDYIDISLKFWNRTPSEGIEYDETTFKRFFEKVSMNIEKTIDNNGRTYFALGNEAKKESGIKWMKYIQTHRNTLAHLGSKSYGVNKEELNFIKTVHNTILEQ